jgi:hypothetical protein
MKVEIEVFIELFGGFESSARLAGHSLGPGQPALDII